MMNVDFCGQVARVVKQFGYPPCLLLPGPCAYVPYIKAKMTDQTAPSPEHRGGENCDGFHSIPYKSNSSPHLGNSIPLLFTVHFRPWSRRAGCKDHKQSRQNLLFTISDYSASISSTYPWISYTSSRITQIRSVKHISFKWLQIKDLIIIPVALKNSKNSN